VRGRRGGEHRRQPATGGEDAVRPTTTRARRGGHTGEGENEWGRGRKMKQNKERGKEGLPAAEVVAAVVGGGGGRRRRGGEVGDRERERGKGVRK